MEIDEIKTKIKFAMDAVEGIDKDYRIEAFKIILAKLIEKNQKSDVFSSGSQEVKDVDSDDPMAILASKAGISKDDLLNVIVFEKNQLTLIKTKGKSTKEENFFASLIILAFWKIGKNKEFLSNVKLGGPISKYGNTTANLSSNLQDDAYQEFIVGKGKGKSKEYRITGKGIVKAFEALRELVQ